MRTLVDADFLWVILVPNTIFIAMLPLGLLIISLGAPPPSFLDFYA